MRDGTYVDGLETEEVSRWCEDADLMAVAFDERSSEVVDESADAVFGGRRVRARQKENPGHRGGISPQAAAC